MENDCFDENVNGNENDRKHGNGIRNPNPDPCWYCCLAWVPHQPSDVGDHIDAHAHGYGYDLDDSRFLFHSFIWFEKE